MRSVFPKYFRALCVKLVRVTHGSISAYWRGKPCAQKESKATGSDFWKATARPVTPSASTLIGEMGPKPVAWCTSLLQALRSQRVDTSKLWPYALVVSPVRSAVTVFPYTRKSAIQAVLKGVT